MPHMQVQPPPLRTESHLLPILAELIPLEPIFHTRSCCSTPEEVEERLAPGYWEVGASGARYTREFIIELLRASPPVDAAAAGWRTSDHALQQLGTSTYLFTYTLDQRPRLTRRATIWQATLHGWQVLYHQGTLVSSAEDEEPA